MRYILTLILFLLTTSTYAQHADSLRMAHVTAELAKALVADTTFLGEVDISVGRVSLPEMVRSIAKVSRVNITVKGADELMVTCNFARARIYDIILFLCREYRLDIDVAGNILSLRPAVMPPPRPKIPQISYNSADTTLNYDLTGEKLIDVAKKISSLAEVNLIVPEQLYGRNVSGFVRDMPLKDAIYTLASVNALDVQDVKLGVWAFYENPAVQQQPGMGSPPHQAAYTPRRRFTPDQLTVDSLGLITAQIAQGSLSDIVTDLCREQGFNYFFASPVSGTTSIYVKQVSFETLLEVMFKGTAFSYYQERGIYVFGQSSQDGALAAVKVIPLRYRSANKIDTVIPTALKTGLQLQVFPDLNGVIVSGDSRQVARVENFLQSIDITVPLVTIEVMIVDATRSDIQEVGIRMGIGDKPIATTGTLAPGINMTLGAQSVNNLINSFNGFGSVNLGKVNPNFYMSLKALEDNGVIEVRSTPKLSTLNGHEATLKSGETKYYKEIVNSYFGSQTPIQNESYTWKNVEANMNIKITPFVSADGHITLEIEIEQTEFTVREEPDAPPGTATRSFKSLIRVQNEEMVLLGGIDRNTRERNTSGLPFIARVPVLRWLTGQSKNNKVDHKLNIFIKPTIID